MIPNMRQAYGKQYRVRLDPAADSWFDPWLHIIPTRSGEVYVHSEEHAGVEVKRSYGQVATRLREVGYQLHQDGDDARVYLVPWADLPTVLPWLRPRRRRQLTEEQRQASAARLAAYQFQKADAAQTLRGEQGDTLNPLDGGLPV